MLLLMKKLVYVLSTMHLVSPCMCHHLPKNVMQDSKFIRFRRNHPGQTEHDHYSSDMTKSVSTIIESITGNWNLWSHISLVGNSHEGKLRTFYWRREKQDIGTATPSWFPKNDIVPEMQPRFPKLETKFLNLYNDCQFNTPFYHYLE
jgi:ABC-type histidine transport system ATPase subunit